MSHYLLQKDTLFPHFPVKVLSPVSVLKIIKSPGLRKRFKTPLIDCMGIDPGGEIEYT